MKRIMLLLFLLVTLDAVACLNGGGRIRDLTFPKVKGGLIEKAEVSERTLQLQKRQYLREYQDFGKVEDYLDYGVTLVLLGEHELAKNVFHEIESKSPDLYATAANLGTVYELLGQPDSALFWIQRAIKLDPGSHEGSEWIHVKILHHKLKSNTGNSSSILGLDFGNGIMPENINNLSLEETLRQMRYQLGERIYFISPPDPVMGNLFFDYGNLFALQEDYSAAIESYGMAQKYGFNSDLLQQRKKYFTLQLAYKQAKEEESIAQATGSENEELAERIEVLEEDLGIREKSTFGTFMRGNTLFVAGGAILGLLLAVFASVVVLRRRKL